MTQQGVVLSIQVMRAHRQPPVPVEEVRALVGYGLEGDVHGKRSADTSRQVLLVDRRTLETLGFSPGALREQLTVDLPDLESLPRGTHLRIGEAVLEVTIPCEPCEVIGRYNRVADPDALRERLRGQRGMMSRVVATTGQGRIRRGDPIVVDVASTEQASVP